MNNMIRFESDYTQGAVPEIIDALVRTNMEMTPGYGKDEYCLSAERKIKKELESENADVHFLVGGTQTNLTFIASVVRPYQAVICADTGHINVHECGSIEACGTKLLQIPSLDGKIKAEEIEKIARDHVEDENREHAVQPGMVYISFPTENGTLYSKKELADIYAVCREYDMFLYIDGARLGYGLASDKNDLEMKDFASLCDAFYIGGTKVGALFGEALVILNDRCKKDFRYMEKQKGAMLAKGRLLGLQFDALFTDGLYYRVSDHAVSLAKKIRTALEEKGIELLYDSPTNQQFPIVTKEQRDKLGEEFAYSPWCKVGDKYAIRFCTSWATEEKNVDKLVDAIKAL